MITVERVQIKYSTCFDKAITWLNRNGYSVQPKAIRIDVTKMPRDTVAVTTSQPIHFQDWPQRNESHHRIHILVSILETVSLKSAACIKATTKVTYFRVKNDVAVAIESLHFDCELPPVPQHPICHVQNDTGYVSPPESFTRKINAAPLQARCQNVRVPTAFINMPGLFAILAATHMSQAQWIEFMAECQTYFQGIPSLELNDQVDGVISASRLCAWAWYQR